MSVDLRLPNIKGGTEQEQIAQIKSYLYQFVEQLNWALNTVMPSGAAAEAVYETETKSGGGGKPPEEEAITTFNSIKALIIKSADIVNAYYDTMKLRLDGVYVANSDFGEFSQHVTDDISLNAEGISQAFSNIQAVSNSVSGLESNLSAVTANIKTGLLYTDGDGNPVYGLEVGQRNVVDGVETFRKYARFTANRLSFYDQNDTEVAYVSDYKLYITNAQITGNLTLGRYVADTTDGLAFKWV